MSVTPDASDFQIRICNGSSAEEVARRLLLVECVAVGVTCAMDIFLSHKSSHWDILADSGVAECDFVLLGNVSLGVGILERNGRNAVVRLKSSDYWRWNSAVQAAVDGYCKPLARQFRAK